MAEPKPHKPVLFFCGILASTDAALEIAQSRLQALLGRIEIETTPYQHKYTSYYKKQMGDNILRKFVAFLPLRQPTELKTLKLKTNETEQELADELKTPFARPVNLDPGYLDEPRVVLASCKDYNHRIALGDGVFADLHLIYRRTLGYMGLEWSYQDYTDEVANDFFLQCRKLLRSERLKIKLTNNS